MRLSQVLNLVLSRDPKQLVKTYEREQVPSDAEIVDSLTNSRSESSRVLTASGIYTADLTGFPNGKFIFVETDKTLSVSINGRAVTVAPLAKSTAPNAATVPGKLVLWTDAITALVFTNPSATEAVTFTWAIAG